MLRYLTAGESHGKCLTAILDGVPANLVLSEDDINEELRRRQVGYGRGNRMSIERDTAEITSGVRFGKTIGAPVAMIIKNRDWQNWKEIMNVWARGNGQGARGEEVTRPRPGHADLAGVLKYRQYDIRNILERSSARETAARVAVGAVCKKFLDEFGIKVMSWVVEIGGVRSQGPAPAGFKRGSGVRSEKDIEDIFKLAEVSDVRCPDKNTAQKMIKKIREVKKRGDSIGGIVEIITIGVPPGLGEPVFDKLNADIAKALMSIGAVKGVEIGSGFKSALLFGSQNNDEMYIKDKRVAFRTNNAGGILGGISNGDDIVVRIAVKPTASIFRTQKTIDNYGKEIEIKVGGRHDPCICPRIVPVAEAMMSIVMVDHLFRARL